MRHPTLHNRLGRPLPSRGFTLTEIMFATAIGSVMMIGIITSYIFSLKGFRALSNYTQLNAESRIAMDWFSRDARMGMAVSSFSSNQIVLVVPTAFSSTNGLITASNFVTHAFSPQGWYRTVAGTGKTSLLATSVTAVAFRMYDRVDVVTTQATQAVSVQVTAQLSKTILSQRQSQQVLSARLRMRNKS
jgi:prepilin-type N-terminal cleavage/methylation domain-containing protein